MTVYYLPETEGWGSTFGGQPTAIWKPQVLTGGGEFGIRDGHLTFDSFWARGKVVVVEACGDLAHPDWVQVGTRTLTENVTPFSDPEEASKLDVQTYAGLTIVGEIAKVYSIEYVTDLTDPVESDWRCLEYLQLPASPYLWADAAAYCAALTERERAAGG